MLKTLKFPLIYVLELALGLLLFTSFVLVLAFVAADPVASLDLAGKSLPPTWEAAVPNHGKFLEGYLIANHPVAFALAVALLAASAATQYPVGKAILAQRESDGASRVMVHSIAHICVVVAWFTIACMVQYYFLAGVSPA